MSTTEQRSGFRLPWASEPRADETGAAQPAARDQALPDDADVPAGHPDPDWPERDAVTPAVEAPGPSGAPVRPPNPLVAGLVRAMREAAQTARDEAAARVVEQAKARIDSIHAVASEDAAAIRRRADEDVAGIREWSKGEVARIKEATERRIAARRQRLDEEVEGNAARVEHRIEWVRSVISDYEGRVDVFFQGLLAEEDPARLAGLAEQLPEPPALDDVPDMDGAYRSGALAADDAAAAEAAAFVDLVDFPDIEPSSAAEPAGDDPVQAGIPDDTVETAAAVPADDLPTVTSRFAVVGLTSVASIAGFKRSVSRAPGVLSASVVSGPGGDFIFTIAHGPNTDMRGLVSSLPGFTITITGDTDGVLSLTAVEPESATTTRTS